MPVTLDSNNINSSALQNLIKSSLTPKLQILNLEKNELKKGDIETIQFNQNKLPELSSLDLCNVRLIQLKIVWTLSALNCSVKSPCQSSITCISVTMLLMQSETASIHSVHLSCSRIATCLHSAAFKSMATNSIPAKSIRLRR